MSVRNTATLLVGFGVAAIALGALAIVVIGGDIVAALREAHRGLVAPTTAVVIWICLKRPSRTTSPDSDRQATGREPRG